jgi:hypothetical protein
MRFPFVPMPAGSFGSIPMPFLPVRLAFNQVAFDEVALVDSGAALNVLPFDLGIRLGFNWNASSPALSLVGNLGGYPAKAVRLNVVIGAFPPVQLGFAWSRDPNARLLLGQVNFFTEFDVCFYQSQGIFEVNPRP